MKNVLILLVVCAILCGITYTIGRKDGVKSVTITEHEESSSKTIHDTIWIPAPTPDPEVKVITKYVRDTVYVTDSLGNKEPIEVDLPVETKQYTDDSTYRAQVTGYKASLDWVQVYQNTVYNEHTVFKTQEIKTKPKWGLGVHVGAGYGIGDNRIRPVVSIGLQYNFLTF